MRSVVDCGDRAVKFTQQTEIDLLKHRIKRLENQNQGLKSTLQQTLGIIRQMASGLGDGQIRDRCMNLAQSLESMSQASTKQ